MDVFNLFAKIALDTSEYEKGLNQSKKSFSQYRSDVAKMANELMKQGMDRSTAMAEAYKRIDKSQYDLAENAKKDAKVFSDSWNGAGVSIDGLADKLKNGLAAAAKVGAAAIGAATAATTAFAASSVKTGMTFDKSMSQVAATMGKTVDEIQELRDFAMDMGAKTAFSATQAADALNYMALAGYDASTSMSMLPTVLNLAAAGSVDLASASDMVTDAQSALGLSIEETAELVDKLAMASSKSNTSVAQLGDAILTVGGTAKSLSGGTTELSAVLGVLADNSIKGAEGGTHLRNIILSMTPKTEAAANAFKALNLETYDAQGNLRPLQDIFLDMNKAMSGMSDYERTNIISSIFNQTDLSSINALLATSAERWDELTGYIDNAAGAAEQMANTQLDNLAGDITLFQSALEGAQIVLSDQLTPSLREFVQFATSGITAISDAFKGGSEYISDFLANGGVETFAAELENVGVVSKDLAGDVAGYFAVLYEAGASAIEIQEALQHRFGLTAEEAASAVETMTQTIESGGLSRAMDAFGTVLSDGLNMVIEKLPTMVDAGMQLLGALGQGIIDNLPTIADAAIKIVTTLAAGISKAIVRLAPIIKKELPKLMSAILPGLVSAVSSLVVSLANTIPDMLPALVDAAIQVVDEIGKGLAEKIPALSFVFDNLETVVTLATVAMVSYKAAVAISSIVETLSKAISALKLATEGQTIAQWALNAAMNANPIVLIITLIGTLVGAIMYLWSTNEDFRKFLTDMWGGITDFFSKGWEKTKEVYSEVGGFFKETFTRGYENTKEAWSKTLDFLANAWEKTKETYSAVGDFFRDTFTTGYENTKTVWSQIGGFFSDSWDKTKETYAEVADFFGETFSSAWDAVTSVWDTVTDFFSDIWDNITGVFGDVWDKFLEIGNNIIEGIKQGISDAWDSFTGWIKDLFNGIVDGVKDLLGIHSPSTVFAGIGENMALGLGAGWEDEFSSIKNKIEDGMDFGTANMGLDFQTGSVDFESSGLAQSGKSMAGYFANTVVSSVGSQETVINLTTELDGKVISRNTFRYNEQEETRRGSPLVNG